MVGIPGDCNKKRWLKMPEDLGIHTLVPGGLLEICPKGMRAEPPASWKDTGQPGGEACAFTQGKKVGLFARKPGTCCVQSSVGKKRPEGDIAGPKSMNVRNALNCRHKEGRNPNEDGESVSLMRKRRIPKVINVV